MIQTLAPVTMAWLLLLAQGALHRLPGLHLDLASIVIAYLILERPVLSGAAAALMVGYLHDLGAGAPTGLGAAAAVLAFLTGRVAISKVTASGPVLRAALCVASSALTLGYSLAIDGLVGPGTASLLGALPALPTIALSAIILCYPVHALLARIDEQLGGGEEDFLLR